MKPTLQRINWIITPNGWHEDGQHLRASVFVAPRLEFDSTANLTLKDFDDFLDWPATLNQMRDGFRVKLGSQEFSANQVEITSANADSTLWQALFPGDSHLLPFDFEDHDDKVFASYPVSYVVDFLKRQYGQLAMQTPSELPSVKAMIDKQGELIKLAFVNSRESINIDKHHMVALGTIKAIQQLWQKRAWTRGNQADTAHDYAYLNLFHKFATQPVSSGPLPEKKFDFHEAVSALGHYPEALRWLGLVFDLNIPYAQELAPNKHMDLRLLHGKFSQSDPLRTHIAPWTRCHLSKQGFVAVARNSDFIKDGMLQLDKPDFDVVQVDVDGAALKLIDFASNLVNAYNPVNGKQSSDSPQNAAPPSLRSGGLALVINDQANKLLGSLQQSKTLEGQSNQSNLTMFAEDLLLGYRIDVRDNYGKQWLSLCRRRGHIRFPDTKPVVNKKIEYDECEGFISPSVGEGNAEELTQGSPNPPKTMIVSESLFRWDGWSLVAPRPGKSVAEPGVDEKGNHYLERAETLDNKAAANFKLEASFRATPGTLPRLRFGHVYQLRARVVDLTGNSPPYHSPESMNVTSPTPYLRFQPIANPALVARDEYTEGESLETLVIRSSYDGDLKAKHSDRHVAPPHCAQLIAEQHGMFDGDKALDKKAYQQIITLEDNKDNVPVSDDIKQLREHPERFAKAQLPMSYLPDPLAGAAIFYGLPGAPGANPTKVGFYQRHANGEPSSAEVKGVWPNAQPFRIRIVEGSGAPSWQNGELLVQLPPAESVVVRYSSLLFKDNLRLMAMLPWAEAALADEPDAQIRQQKLENFHSAAVNGAHWAITPYRQIRLVHAVRQPKDAPVTEIRLKAGGNYDTQPPETFAQVWDYISRQGNSGQTLDLAQEGQKFVSQQPFSDTRKQGETFTRLYGFIDLHGKSTGKVDLIAQWQEVIDDPADTDGPRHVSVQGRPPLTVKAMLAESPVLLDGTPTPVASGTIKYLTTGQGRAGLQLGPYVQKKGPNPGGSLLMQATPIQHEFGDTKARLVSYSCDATTRFREYFSPMRDVQKQKLAQLVGKPSELAALKQKMALEEQQFVKTAQNQYAIVIPSSARPAAPEIAYVIPTFGWESDKKGDTYTSKRLGNSLRVYLKRPWFSSGDCEMLGVVVYVPTKQTKFTIPPSMRPYVTRWGQDPIWESSKTKQKPLTTIFSTTDLPGFNLTLDELDDEPKHRVSVAGYHVYYDKERGLWYSDIVMNTGFSYFPFVRLALARYQPFAIDNMQLSRVAAAEYIQLAPERSASLSIKEKTANQIKISVAVSSPTFYTNTVLRRGGSLMVASVEMRNPSIDDPDLSWNTLADSEVTLTSSTSELIARKQIGEEEKVFSPDKIHHWKGTVTLANYHSDRQYRIVVKEYERFASNQQPLRSTGLQNMFGTTADEVRRLVYADTIALENLLS